MSMKSCSKSLIASFAVATLVALTVPSSNAAADLTVVATANPLWTDTGIALAATDLIRIHGAAGAWKTQSTFPLDGPDGSIHCEYVWDEWVTDAHHGQLIGFVGNDPSVVSQDDPALFVVSTNSVTFTGKTGELWLGCNDAFATRHPGNIGVNDNSGSVTVSVARAALPKNLGIALNGADGLLFIPTISSNLYSYSIQTTSDLRSNSWGTIGYNFVRPGDVLTNIDVGAATFPKRFYRMAVTTAPQPASDNAADSAYSCGWIMSIAAWNGSVFTGGITGGVGFGPWKLTATGVIGSSSNGFFIGSSINNASGMSPGIDVGGKSWGIYASSNDFAAAYRAFANGPLPVGGTLQVDLDNGVIDTNSSVGLVIRNDNASSSPSDYEVGARFEFLFLGGDSSNSYKVVDAQGLQNIGVPFTGTGLHVVFTLITTNTYTLLTIDNASNTTNTFTGALGGAAGSTLDSLALYNLNAGKGPEHDCFFNSLAVVDLAPVTYTISTGSLPADGGFTSGGWTVAPGSNVTVCASASSCYSFANWTDESSNVVSTTACYSFTAGTNRNLVANFALRTDTISTSSSPASGGSTSGGGTVACGSKVTVRATANACYSFLNWTDPGSNEVSTTACYSFTATTNRNLVANFAPLTYTIGTSSSPASSGSTSGGGTVACGSNVTVCATANPCCSFVNWIDESSNVVSMTACYSFTATTNHNLVANFAP